MPYSIHSIKVLAIIVLIFLLFADKDGDGSAIYFLIKNLDLELSNIIKITLNSLLVSIIYMFMIYKSKSSESINTFINNLLAGNFRF